MSFLQNASIRTKILSLILPLCIVGLGAAAYMSTRYKEADTAYSLFIANDNAALVELARANRNLVALAYGAYQVMAYDVNGPEIKAAKQAYSDSKGALLQRLNNAKTVFPEESAAMDAFIAQSQAIPAGRVRRARWCRTVSRRCLPCRLRRSCRIRRNQLAWSQP
ncbi:exported hypothetical protein [Agrobacterium deltaense Zutra 3/1]|uniref:Uncharacterized protein n=1 Tax=Agrobacterium deltaense Zutra 3/1 TaxID=1183427 RepID=A0A1S7QL86_9HYPH|nr:hypothetical protein [Agrobacterium deltaense]CUX38374.1 exported hypothetical protein [Agrobacterium deltaense Zutra 3/1]